MNLCLPESHQWPKNYLKQEKLQEHGTNASHDYFISKIKNQKIGQSAFIKTLWYSANHKLQSQWKWKVFRSLITSILPLMYAPMFKMTLLNCCKHFWWLYNADTKDALFFLFSLNYFQLLFVLMILEVWSIVFWS